MSQYTLVSQAYFLFHIDPSTATATFVGCFRDAASRALDGASTSDDDMTLQMCLLFCDGHRSFYLGIQVGHNNFGNIFTR